MRAWRFGRDDLRLGGIGEVGPYLERYNELTGREIRLEELDYWEVAGNVAWAIGCVTQARRHLTGQERSVELAILGRLGAEVEYEICHLLEARASHEPSHVRMSSPRRSRSSSPARSSPRSTIIGSASGCSSRSTRSASSGASSTALPEQDDTDARELAAKIRAGDVAAGNARSRQGSSSPTRLAGRFAPLPRPLLI